MELWKIYVTINVLFVLLVTFIYFKNKKVTKNQIKDNKEKIKVVKAKIQKVEAQKVKTVKAIKNQEVKTSEIKAKVKGTTTAKKTTEDFKKKYRKKS
tara:strand:+ start:1980 stop:2270 length:291 start_codon:yes stop_codon:yes gene_type:complete